MEIPKIEAPNTATQYVMENLLPCLTTIVEQFIGDIYDKWLPYVSVESIRNIWDVDVPKWASQHCLHTMMLYETDDIDLWHQQLMYVNEADYSWLCTLVAERLMLLDHGFQGYDKFVSTMGSKLGTVSGKAVVVKVQPC